MEKILYILTLPLLTSILTLVTAPLYSQTYAQNTDPDKKIAFKDGEQLVYQVGYKVGFVNVDVATVTFSVTKNSFHGVPTYKIEAVGKVNPEYTWFYNLHDVYNTWVDTTSLRPLFFENDIREGDYRYKSNYKYNWDSMKVKTTAIYPNRDETKIRDFKLSEVSYDAVSLFYNMRSIDIEKSKKGKPEILDVVFADKVRRIEYQFIGTETKNIKDIGKFKTLKFSCQLTNASGDSFKEGSEFFLWISDDDNHIPLYLESPIKVGSIRVRIVNTSNLKYPLNSRIKK